MFFIYCLIAIGLASVFIIPKFMWRYFFTCMKNKCNFLSSKFLSESIEIEEYIKILWEGTKKGNIVWEICGYPNRKFKQYKTVFDGKDFVCNMYMKCGIFENEYKEIYSKMTNAIVYGSPSNNKNIDKIEIFRSKAFGKLLIKKDKINKKNEERKNIINFISKR